MPYPPIKPKRKPVINHSALAADGTMYAHFKGTDVYKKRIAQLTALNAGLAADVEVNGIGYELDRSGYYKFRTSQLCAKLSAGTGDLTTKEWGILLKIAIQYAEYVRNQVIVELPF
jgi:hypothetical protein